jgi:hypothetical protein
VVAVAATFLHTETLFRVLGADFNIGHVVGYSAQIIFAAAISSGIYLRGWGMKAEDRIIHARLSGDTRPAGICDRALAAIGRVFTLK